MRIYSGRLNRQISKKWQFLQDCFANNNPIIGWDDGIVIDYGKSYLMITVEPIVRV